MSGKVVVVYKSKYGSAKRYAQWIADELGADLYEQSKIGADKLLQYDTIIYGGSLYAVGILGISLIKNHFDKLKVKQVVVFSVGASPAYPEAMEKVKSHNFTDEMKGKIQYFHLRGAFNFEKMGLLHKLMISFMKNSIKKKKPEELTKDDKDFLACFENPVDWTDKETIKPILEYVNKTKG